MKNLSIFFSALVALLFSVAETSAQITPPYYNPANVNITGGNINGTVIGGMTPAAATFTTVWSTNAATLSSTKIGVNNDLYLTRYGAKQLMISGDGVGATTNAGFIFGYSGTSGYGSIWGSDQIPGAVNYILQGNGSFTAINSNASLFLRNANVDKLTISGTLSTSVNPVSITDATDSSSTTTGSLKTAGGLGVAKKAYFGETITSTGAIYGGTTTGSNVGLFIYKNTSTGVTNDSAVFIRQDGTDDIAKFTKASGVNVASINSSGLYVDTPGTIRVGSGSTTSAGLIAGYYGSSGYGAIWSTSVTPGLTNFAFTSNGQGSYLNGTVASGLQVNNSARLSADSTGLTHIGNMVYDKTITASGTTGAVTINKTTGRVNFAAAATSLVVTNSLATANSICHVTKATNDATMRLGACVAAAESITIYADVAPAAETAVNFTITN